MKRLICLLLAVGLLSACSGALAASKMTEATMIYEDYDGNRSEQTVVDDGTLQELQDMLLRAKKNKGELENCTMNSCSAGLARTRFLTSRSLPTVAPT